MPDEKLTVFISSSMNAPWLGIRFDLERLLRQVGIEPRVYESDCEAAQRDPMEESLRLLHESVLYLALFGNSLGPGTVKEFDWAEQENKPRFIYIYHAPNLQRDQQLQTFLEKRVLRAGSGVTAEYFEGITQVASSATRQIHKWLVEQYYRLGDKVEQQVRLQRMTTQPLGNALEHLDNQLYAWLEAGNHVVERRNVGAEYFEYAVQYGDPGVRRRVLILGFTGEAELGHLKLLKDRLHTDRHAREGWLLSWRPASDSVRKELDDRRGSETSLACFTFDELVCREAHVPDYFAWLGAEIQNRGIDKFYVPLTCTKDEYDLNRDNRLGYSRYDARNGGIDGYVDRWLDDPSKQHISVLGEFGTGKSWFALHYAWASMLRYQEAARTGRVRPRLPLVIPLRDFSHEGSIRNLLESYLDGSRGIRMSFDAFQQLNRMGKLLLIFDGFDEMAMDRHPDKVMEHFWELAKVAQAGAKVIITCRAEHFLNNERGRKYLWGQLEQAPGSLDVKAPRFEILTLEMLEDEQLRDLIRCRYGKRHASRVMDNPRLLKEARRPVMIDFIVEAIRDIDPSTPVDLARLYLHAVRRKMQRLKADDFRSSADKLYFFCELSWHMLDSARMTVNCSDFPVSLRTYFDRQGFDPLRCEQACQDATQESMFTRSARGDYTPTHRSLVEFFAAYKLVAQLGVLDREFSELAQHVTRSRFRSEADEHTWSEHFSPSNRVHGRGNRSVRLRSFGFDTDDSGRGLVRLERLTPNAIRLAAQMVAGDPTTIERICKASWEAEGIPAWNAQGLVPFLREKFGAEQIADFLLRKAGQEPLPFGVPWILGELGRDSSEVGHRVDVQAALVRTADALRGSRREHGHPAWQSSFALMKIGALGPDALRDRNFDEPIQFLIERLPDGYDLPTALANLERTLQAHGTAARIDERDIIAVAKAVREDEGAALKSFLPLLNHCNLTEDRKGRRAYYMVWLCSLLRLKPAVPKILDAILHRDDSVCTCSAEALGRIGVNEPAIVRALENTLQHNYYRARYHAALSLADLRACESVPALEAASRWELVDSVREAMDAARRRLEDERR